MWGRWWWEKRVEGCVVLKPQRIPGTTQEEGICVFATLAGFPSGSEEKLAQW